MPPTVMIESSELSWNQTPLEFTDDEALKHAQLEDLLQQLSALIVLLSVTLALALVGNFFLAVLILRMSLRRLGPVQILILHTCIADICFAFLTILPELAATITFPTFYGNELLCRIVKYVQLVPMFASPFLLVAISIDRYVAICKPLTALKWKYRLVHVLAASAWTCSMVFSVPNLIATDFSYEGNMSVPICAFISNKTFEIVHAMAFIICAWLVPSIVVGTLYTNVCVTVWRSLRCSDKKHTATAANSLLKSDYFGNGYTASLPRYSSLETAADQTRVNVSVRKNFARSINVYKIKTVKLTLTIVVCNFVLLAPFCISNIINMFPEMEKYNFIITCVMLVGNANSCVNPWIYVIFNYKRVWELLRGINRSSSHSSKYQPVSSKPTSRHIGSDNGYHANKHGYHHATPNDWTPPKDRPKRQQLIDARK